MRCLAKVGRRRPSHGFTWRHTVRRRTRRSWSPDRTTRCALRPRSASSHSSHVWARRTIQKGWSTKPHRSQSWSRSDSRSNMHWAETRTVTWAATGHLTRNWTRPPTWKRHGSAGSVGSTRCSHSAWRARWHVGILHQWWPSHVDGSVRSVGANRARTVARRAKRWARFRGKCTVARRNDGRTHHRRTSWTTGTTAGREMRRGRRTRRESRIAARWKNVEIW